jgi:hypothetical protein
MFFVRMQRLLWACDMREQTADASFMRKGEGQRKREMTANEKQAEAARAEQSRQKSKPPVPTRDECLSAEKVLKGNKAETHQDYIRRNALQAIRYCAVLLSFTGRYSCIYAVLNQEMCFDGIKRILHI